VSNVPTIPDNAPFSAAQRSWLNGFFAGLMSNGDTHDATPPAPDAMTADDASSNGDTHAPTWRNVDEEDAEYDWHDPSLPIDERMQLTEGKPLEFRLMGAMAQLDCGSCGYLCRSYAKAIADGEEPDMTKCVPGGKETARMVKKIVKEEAPAEPNNNGHPPQTEAPPADAANNAGVDTSDIEVAPAHDRSNPFPAPLLAVERLTTSASTKDTRFVSLSLAGSGMQYEVGDSVGVFPQNNFEQVDALIRLLGVGGGEPVTLDGAQRTLRDVLIDTCDIAEPSDELYELLAGCAQDDAEAEALQAALDGQAVDGLVDEPRVIDLLARFTSARPMVSRLVGALDRLQPRLYSISSSPRAYPDEVHLTVGVVRYEKEGQPRQGIASTFLTERLMHRQPVRCYIQPSHGFRLPEDDSAPIIMVGPGTGVAPFRAFLQDRKTRGASGDNWLFFGE